MTESTNDTPDWVDTLTEKLATDEEFRLMFERTPGKAANSIGVPYEDFQGLMAAMRDPAEAELAERSSAGYMTTYGSIMTKIRGALNCADQCACDYAAGRLADYCVTS